MHSPELLELKKYFRKKHKERDRIFLEETLKKLKSTHKAEIEKKISELEKELSALRQNLRALER